MKKYASIKSKKLLNNKQIFLQFFYFVSKSVVLVKLRFETGLSYLKFKFV